MNKVLRALRKVYLHYLRARNKKDKITIISQNCIGGVIYNDLGLEFMSPTINMFIEDENFVKLVSDVKHYMNIVPEAIEDTYVDPIDASITYPKIRIDDIELCCLHYSNCREAIDAWERRKKRIDYNNIYVIGNSWNMHSNQELVYELLDRSQYKTVIFTLDKIDDKRCIQLPGNIWRLDSRGIVRPNITDEIPGSIYKYFEKMFDFVGWLNEK